MSVFDIAGRILKADIGMTVNWRLLYVVYVMRDDTIRLISARKVTKAERKRYEDQ